MRRKKLLPLPLLLVFNPVPNSRILVYIFLTSFLLEYLADNAVLITYLWSTDLSIYVIRNLFITSYTVAVHQYIEEQKLIHSYNVEIRLVITK